VLRDDASKRCLLFATARSSNDFGVVTVASSTDLVHWRGVGFIDATRRFARSANWQYRGYTPDPGVNAIKWLLVGGAEIVSQSISNPDCPDHAKHRRDLRLRHLN
jgi:hypothetical protein